MILASESKSGKGRLKKLLQWMGPNTYNSSSASPAWVYTQITKSKKEGYTPTLFIDEIGKYFNGKRDTSEMEAVLCAGVEKDELVTRATFDKNGKRDVEELETFCPKVLSGIQNESQGFFPEDLLSRANIIRMHRRTSQEWINRFAQKRLNERVLTSRKGGRDGPQIGARWLRLIYRMFQSGLKIDCLIEPNPLLSLDAC
jgi:hypothetical protein